MLGSDNLSKINLEKLGIKSAEFVPDALYKFENLNNNSLERKYICIGDTATLGYAEWDVANFFEDIITRLKKQGQEIIFVDGNMWKTTEIIEKLCNKLKVSWVHLDNTNWRELAEIFRQSKVFFSGRWHASILATISGTPSILYGTDKSQNESFTQ